MIRVNVVHQSLRPVHIDKIVSGSYKYLTLEAHFDPTWDGFKKTAYFRQDDSELKFELCNDAISKECGINLSSGCWKLSFTGTKGNVQITTNQIDIEVETFTPYFL